MKLFNFANMGDDLEEFILIKSDIEKYLLTNHEIDEKLSLEQFITNMFANTIIYFTCNKTLPFTILNSEHEMYLIYTDVNKDEILLQGLLDYLKQLSYDINKLTKVELANTLTINYDKDTFFIKDGTYYK